MIAMLAARAVRSAGEPWWVYALYVLGAIFLIVLMCMGRWAWNAFWILVMGGVCAWGIIKGIDKGSISEAVVAAFGLVLFTFPLWFGWWLGRNKR